jgi:hypothetical protein
LKADQEVDSSVFELRGCQGATGWLDSVLSCRDVARWLAKVGEAAPRVVPSGSRRLRDRPDAFNRFVRTVG